MQFEKQTSDASLDCMASSAERVLRALDLVEMREANERREQVGAPFCLSSEDRGRDGYGIALDLHNQVPANRLFGQERGKARYALSPYISCHDASAIFRVNLV